VPHNTKNFSLLDVGLGIPYQDRSPCPPCIFEYPSHRRLAHQLPTNNHDACYGYEPVTPSAAVAPPPTPPCPSIVAPDAPSLRWFMLSGHTKALSAVSLDQCLPAKAVSAVLLGQRSAYQLKAYTRNKLLYIFLFSLPLNETRAMYVFEKNIFFIGTIF
jgi:hypothetical protein